MRNPIRIFLDWYHRQNIRIQIVVAIIGASGFVLAAGVGGCFNLLSVFVQSGTHRGENLSAASVVQQGSGNFQVGRDLSVTGDLNLQGSVGRIIVIAPKKLLPTEKAVLAQAFQAKNGGIPFDPKLLYEKWKEIENLPQSSRDSEVLDAVHSLERQGLIEMTDLKPNEKGGVTRSFRITPLGEKVILSMPRGQ